MIDSEFLDDLDAMDSDLLEDIEESDGEFVIDSQLEDMIWDDPEQLVSADDLSAMIDEMLELKEYERDTMNFTYDGRSLEGVPMARMKNPDFVIFNIDDTLVKIDITKIKLE